MSVPNNADTSRPDTHADDADQLAREVSVWLSLDQHREWLHALENIRAVPMRALFVARVFADYAPAARASGHPGVWVTYAQLTRHTHMRRERLAEALAWLRDAGWLVVVRGGERRRTYYGLAVPNTASGSAGGTRPAVARSGSDGRTSSGSDGRTSSGSDGGTTNVIERPLTSEEEERTRARDQGKPAGDQAGDRSAGPDQKRNQTPDQTGPAEPDAGPEAEPGRTSPAARLAAAAGLTEAEVNRLVAYVRRTRPDVRRPYGYLRTLHKAGDLHELVEDARLAARPAASASGAREEAEDCHHGTPNGTYRRADGTLACPFCRRAEDRQQRDQQHQEQEQQEQQRDVWAELSKLFNRPPVDEQRPPVDEQPVTTTVLQAESCPDCGVYLDPDGTCFVCAMGRMSA